MAKDGLPCYDLERTICDHFKNHTNISYRRLRELSKKYRDSDDPKIDLLKSYAEQLNLSVEAMKKMDWLILRYYRPKKKKSGQKRIAKKNNLRSVKI